MDMLYKELASNSISIYHCLYQWQHNPSSIYSTLHSFKVKQENKINTQDKILLHCDLTLTQDLDIQSTIQGTHSDKRSTYWECVQAQ